MTMVLAINLVTAFIDLVHFISGFLMKIFCSVLLSIFCFFSSVVFADVSIGLKEGIVLLAHNGKEVLSDSTILKQDKLLIKNGIHQIVVQYTGEIKKSNSDSAIESTGTYIIVFEAVDERLMLDITPLKNSYDFNDFKKVPKWQLTGDAGEIKDIKVVELVKEGFQFNRDYEKELAIFNMQDSPLAIMPHIELPVINNTVQTDMAEKMLRYWYVNATPEVKAAFIKWIGK